MTDELENFPGREYDKETILAETDPDNLKAIMEDLDGRIKHIESQLEFRSEAGPDWERRAIAALAANRILYGVAGKQYHTYSGRKASNLAAEADLKIAKQMKRQNQIEREKLEREQRLARAEKARIAVIENAIRSLNSGRFQRAFWQVAREQLPRDTFDRIANEAEDRMEKASLETLKQAGLTQILAANEPHDSGCATHNMPAFPSEPCDCREAAQ